MALPKVIVGGAQVEVTRRKTSKLNELLVQLRRLRNAANGIYATAKDISKIEIEQADILRTSMQSYKDLLRREFEIETKLGEIAAEIGNFAHKFKGITERIEMDIAEGKLLNLGEYVQHIKTVFGDAELLLDKYRVLGEIKLSESRYKEFFEKYMPGSEVGPLIRKKLGALNEQYSQLVLAVSAITDMRRLLDSMKI